MMQPTAFDNFASAYDADFSHTPLGLLLRRRVWATLADHFRAGQHVLELACGTGEDAVWLARRGVRVTATDGAAEMVNVARAKVTQAGVDSLVKLKQVSLQNINRDTVGEALFAGVLSNFGGLNTIHDWAGLASRVAEHIKPHGIAIFVPMGPFCPWEVAWYVGHGQVGQGLRRFRQPATATIGERVIPIWYPSRRQLQAAVAPHFTLKATHSLGLWLPPSYLGHLVTRWPRLFTRLNRWEAATAHLTGGWGDHYIAVFERRA